MGVTSSDAGTLVYRGMTAERELRGGVVGRSLTGPAWEGLAPDG